MTEKIKKDTDYWRKKSFSAIKSRLYELCKAIPDATAVHFFENEKELIITYKELYEDITAFGAFLLKKDFVKGKRIVLVGANSYEWIRAALSVVCTDNMLLLFGDSIPADELLDQLYSVKADLVLYDKAQEKKLVSYNGEKISLFDNEPYENCTADEKKYFEKYVPDLDRTACVIFTSGSSGKPKGVMLSERAILSEINGSINIPGFILLEIINLPLYHVLGFGPVLLTSICMGQSLFISGGIKSLFDELRILRPRRIMLMPLQVKMMCDITQGASHEKIKEILGDRMEDFSSAGAPLPSWLKSSFDEFNIFVSDGYGMSEAGGGISAEYKTMEKALESAGVLHARYEYRIENPDAEGFGELYLKSPSIFQGYLDDPEETAKKLVDGWLRTGDVVRIDEKRRVFVRGRADNIIILSNGENISPEYLEKKLSKIEGVKECLVYCVNGELVAEIFCDESTNEESVRDDIRQINKKLAPYQQIFNVIFRKSPFEKTSNGKISRRKAVAESVKDNESTITVSVLTPIHNCPMELLNRARASVEKQVCDKFRLKWFIAVHNMDDQYLGQVKGSVEGLGFAEVFPVDDPLKCVGSVRNALLDKASGDYVFWLDADDELTDGAILKVITRMQEDDSDIAVFKVEEVIDEGANPEYKNISIVPHLTRTVYRKNDAKKYDLINGISKDVYSWGYRYSILKNSDVCFDIGESAAFCETAYVVKIVGMADKISIMPDVSGYVYHVRPESDSYSKSKDPVRFIKGQRRLWYELLLIQKNTGSDLSTFLWTTIGRALMIMFRNPKITPELRQEILDSVSEVLSNIRILRKPTILSDNQIVELTNLIGMMYPEHCKEFLLPRWRHRLVECDYYGKEQIKKQLRDAAASFEGFRTVSDPANPFRGIVKSDAGIGFEVVNFGDKDSDEQERILSGYKKMEELRGFGSDEVRLRVTLFIKNNENASALITWDDHYLSEQSIEWLVEKWMK